MRDKKKKEKLLIELLIAMGLTHDKYHGKLGINFQAGNIICYERNETIKLTE